MYSSLGKRERRTDHLSRIHHKNLSCQADHFTFVRTYSYSSTHNDSHPLCNISITTSQHFLRIIGQLTYYVRRPLFCRQSWDIFLCSTHPHWKFQMWSKRKTGGLWNVFLWCLGVGTELETIQERERNPRHVCCKPHPTFCRASLGCSGDQGRGSGWYLDFCASTSWHMCIRE